MAATVLESITVPRATAFPTSAALSPVFSSSLSTASSVRFPDFKGLKLTTTSSATRSLSSLSRLPRRRRFSSRVSAESSDTLQLPTLSESEWKSLVLESDLPVMVEFWAPWCGPCRMVQPIIDELAQQYAGKLKVYKVNTDECAGIASEYGIRSIPTVLIFKGGEKKDAVIGAVPKSTLTTSIEKFL